MEGSALPSLYPSLLSPSLVPPPFPMIQALDAIIMKPRSHRTNRTDLGTVRVSIVILIFTQNGTWNIITHFHSEI